MKVSAPFYIVTFRYNENQLETHVIEREEDVLKMVAAAPAGHHFTAFYRYFHGGDLEPCEPVYADGMLYMESLTQEVAD